MRSPSDAPSIAVRPAAPGVSDTPFIVRDERVEDVTAIRRVIECAFGQAGEAELVDALRLGDALTVSLVAEAAGEIVGHVAFSPVIIRAGDTLSEALGLAPLAVIPERQRRGIGAALVRAGLDACRARGHRVVVLVGEPAYYQRFGFSTASEFGLECAIPVPVEVFLVAELTPGALAGCSGIASYRPEFDAVSA
jgi:putative acetyltransferase